MGTVYTYSPEDVAFSFGPHLITGWGKDAMIVCERDEDSFTKSVGCDGTVTRTRNANRSGTITITLSASSPSNDVLAGVVMKDELDNSGILPALCKDANGTTVCGGKAWIRKPASVEFGKEVGDREWVFDVDKLATWPGGSKTS